MAGGNMFNFRALPSALAILLLTPLTAHAVSLSLNGNGADLQMDNTQAVYASDSNGVPMLITEVGMRAPGGGIVTEVGVPSMMPDGRVIFGAETQPKDRQHQGAVEYFHRQCRCRPEPSHNRRPQSEGARGRLRTRVQGRPVSGRGYGRKYLVHFDRPARPRCALLLFARQARLHGEGRRQNHRRP